MIEEIAELSKRLGYVLTSTQIRYLEQIIKTNPSKITLEENDIGREKANGKTHTFLVYSIYSLIQLNLPYIIYVSLNARASEYHKKKFLDLLIKTIAIVKGNTISFDENSPTSVVIQVGDKSSVIQFSNFGSYLNYSRGNVYSKIIFDFFQN